MCDLAKWQTDIHKQYKTRLCFVLNPVFLKSPENTVELVSVIKVNESNTKSVKWVHLTAELSLMQHVSVSNAWVAYIGTGIIGYVADADTFYYCFEKKKSNKVSLKQHVFLYLYHRKCLNFTMYTNWLLTCQAVVKNVLYFTQSNR